MKDKLLQKIIKNMWRPLLIVATFFVVFPTAQAASLWYNIQPLPQASRLYDVGCSANECVAVGASGASVNIRPNASMIAGEPYSDAILFRVMRDTNEFLAFQIGTTADPYARILNSKNGYRWAASGGKLVRGNNIVVPTRMIKAGNQYVAVGYDFSLSPFVATSADMFTWTYTAPLTTTLSLAYDIASNPAGTTLVAVGFFQNGGTTNYIYVSTNSGASWAYRTVSTGQILTSVVWDATSSQFVAVGSNGTILTSTDGLTWTDRSIAAATIDLNGIAEHQGLLVAVGLGGAVYSNDAGLTWNYGLNAGANMNAVAWNGSLMLAVGSNGDIRASYDGFLWFEWDYVEANPPIYNDVAVNDLYTVVSVGSRGRLDYSTDNGASWTKGPLSPIPTETYKAVEWVSAVNKFVAVGSSLAKTSLSGTSWSSAGTPPAGTVSDLAFSSPTVTTANLVAVGGTSSYTSSNGSTWTSHPAALVSSANGVAAMSKSPYTFVAVGWNNSVSSSADAGVTWTARTSPITLLTGESLTFNDVFWTTKYGGGIFFAVGTKTLASGDVEGVVIYSYNGTTWTNGTNILPIAVRQNNKFLSINGKGNDIFITGETKNQFSPAGIIIENNVLSFAVWQQVPLPSTPSLQAVTPTNFGGAIAVGNGSVIISKLNDITPPSQIVAPADLTLEAVSATPIPVGDTRIQAWLGQFYATDNLDIRILDIQNNAPSVFNPNTVNSISFTVSDKAGNTIPTPVLRNVIIQDLQAPVVTPPTNIIVPSLPGVLGTTNADVAIVAFLNGATASDNVDGNISGSITNDAPALFPIGTTTVTFSATDSGMPANTGSATANVVVYDAQAPTINLPSPAHYVIAATGSSPLAFTDPYVQQYVSLVTAVDNWDSGLLDVYTSTQPSFPVGTQVFIDFYATDAYGNVGHNLVNSASITVKDLAAPIITPPANITVPSSSGLGALNSNAAIQTFLAAATAVDNVGGVVPSADIYSDAGLIFPVGSNTVTFFTDDAAGNRGTATATITVWDAQAPIVYLPSPADLVLSADTAAGLALSDPYVQQYINAVIALDDYEGQRTLSNDAPTSFPLNQTVSITFTATDSYGNVGTAIGSVTVIDDVPPVLTAPTDISVLATSALGTELGNTLIQAFINSAVATDNVDGSVVVYSDAPNVFPIGITKVTFFADDAGGNRSIATASVEVTPGTGGTPDAASCLVSTGGSSGTSTSWTWLSLLLMFVGMRWNKGGLF